MGATTVEFASQPSRKGPNAQGGYLSVVCDLALSANYDQTNGDTIDFGPVGIGTSVHIDIENTHEDAGAGTCISATLDRRVTPPTLRVYDAGTQITDTTDISAYTLRATVTGFAS